MQNRKKEKMKGLHDIKKLLTKQNMVLVIVLVVIAVGVWKYQKDRQQSFQGDMELQQRVQKILPQQTGTLSQEEIEANAIEYYLYIATLQAFQIAQTTGVESKEYRDYEQRYAEYRMFRDTRIRKMLERNLR
jgi:preprotein translocase subunit SecF